MVFTTIEINSWNRKEHFKHYFNDVPCTYSLNVKLEITNIIKTERHLYSTLLFELTKLINQHQEFRTCFNTNGKLGFYDEMIPCYTVFNKETETFTSIWTPLRENYNDFYAEYKKDVELYSKNIGVIRKPDMPENVFNVSMIPWINFDGFNLNLQKGYDYLLPIFTFGKFYQKDDMYFLPLGLQVHHAVCDGFHAGRFIDELQQKLNNGK